LFLAPLHFQAVQLVQTFFNNALSLLTCNILIGSTLRLKKKNISLTLETKKLQERRDRRKAAELSGADPAVFIYQFKI
jgi:hypothetical protein